MKRRISWLSCCSIAIVTSVSIADVPEFHLGPKPSFGLFQPRVSVEVFEDALGERSLGPASSSFLLDTGASGVVLYPPATTELAAAGFMNDGQFEEIGIAGTDLFHVSSPYRLNFAGTDGRTLHVPDVRLLSGETAPDPTGLMELHGIVGMPAMKGRVTSIDNRSREGALPLSMGVTFSDTLPETATHRFTVPLQELAFPAEGEGPLPTFESLSTLQVVSRHGEATTANDIVLDSGAQFTILSSRIAFDLGLDLNGNGDLMDEAITTVPLSGVSGQINAPVLSIDRMLIPTDQGLSLSWSDAEVVIFDIHPSIQGVLGADFMTDDGGLDLSLLGGGNGGLTDLLGPLLGGGDDLDDLLGGLLGGEGGGLDDLLGGLLGGGEGGEIDDLLGGLLGGGLGGLLGGGGDLFASFPLESYFDQVHFDFRDFPDGDGQLVFDVNSAVSGEILNGDHVFDVRDIDDLTSALSTANIRFDLNDDGVVDAGDRELLIHDILGSLSGDTDVDGDVDFTDFVALTDGFGELAATWGSGDFDGNGVTDFSDFIALSQNFGAPATAAPVPEPATGWLACWALPLWILARRRRIRR